MFRLTRWSLSASVNFAGHSGLWRTCWITLFPLKQLHIICVQHLFNRSDDTVIAGACRWYFNMFICLDFFLKFLKHNKWGHSFYIFREILHNVLLLKCFHSKNRNAIMCENKTGIFGPLSRNSCCWCMACKTPRNWHSQPGTWWLIDLQHFTPWTVSATVSRQESDQRATLVSLMALAVLDGHTTLAAASVTRHLFCSLAMPHHGHTFSIYLGSLSLWLTLPLRVLSMSWCCPSRPCVVFLVCMHLALFLALFLSPGNSLCFIMVTIVC